MEFSSDRLKKLSGLLKEAPEVAAATPAKNVNTLILGYALAIGKKYGHISIGQIRYLLDKKEGIKTDLNVIFSTLMKSGRFNRVQDDSYKSMGIPVFTMKEVKLQEVETSDPTDMKQIAFSELSDAYKEANGFRPRGVFDYEKMSLEDIDQAIQYYSNASSAYNDLDFGDMDADDYYARDDQMAKYHDDDEKAIADLGFDDEYDLMPKHAGMKMAHESTVIREDWDNYQSLEEIEIKYLQKLMLAMGISTSDDRLPQIQEIFKTALSDAQTLGQMNSNAGDNEPPTGV